jgi:hypothetical protein
MNGHVIIFRQTYILGAISVSLHPSPSLETQKVLLLLNWIIPNFLSRGTSSKDT